MRIKLYIFILFITILFTGCLQIKDKGNDSPDFESVDVGSVDKEILNISESISDNVVELYGIVDATSIIFNEEVLLGIILAEDQEMTEDMIDSIIKTIKDKNPYIENVHISLDEDIFIEIDNIVIYLLGGKSYEDYLDEINKIREKINTEK